MFCDPRDHKERKNLPHQIAEERNTSHLRPRQVFNGNPCETVPSKPAGNRRTHIHRNSGQHRTDHSACNGPHNDSRRDNQDSHMIFPDFLYQSMMHSDADTHQKHQQIQNHIPVFNQKSCHRTSKTRQTAQDSSNQRSHCQNNHFASLSFLLSMCESSFFQTSC